MQISSPTSTVIASASISATGGSNSAAQIAKLQKQISNLTSELKRVASDNTQEAKAKQQRAAQLQAQIQVLQQQITAIQEAEAQKAQDNAQYKTQAALEADSTQSASLHKRKEGNLGTNVNNYV